MNQIFNNVYYVNQEYKKTNTIRKTIILNGFDKLDNLNLSLICDILTNSLTSMTKLEFNLKKALNYNVTYTCNTKKVRGNTLLILDINFIELSLIDNVGEVLEFINKIFDDINILESDIKNTILDHQNYLKQMKDEKDVYVKHLLKDNIYIENEEYMTYDNKVKHFNKVKVEDVQELFGRIKSNQNYYLLFEGKDSSLELIKSFLKDISNEQELIIDKKDKFEVSSESETIDLLKTDNQASIAMNIRSNNISLEDADKLKLLNYIYGRETFSKLFKNVREKKSLCYSVYSVDDINFGLEVYTGVDKANVDLAVNEIKLQFNEIKSGNIEDEFELAKNQLINDINNQKNNFFYLALLLEKNIIEQVDKYEIGKIIKRIEKIEKDEILALANDMEVSKVLILN